MRLALPVIQPQASFLVAQTPQEFARAQMREAAARVEDGILYAQDQRPARAHDEWRAARDLLGVAMALLEEVQEVQAWARAYLLRERLRRDLDLVRAGADGFTVRPLDLEIKIEPQRAAKMWGARPSLGRRGVK